MLRHKPYSLVALVLTLFLISCTKWKFNNRFEGRYIGVRELRFDHNGNPQVRTASDEVQVSTLSKQKTFTVSSLNGYMSHEFHYDGSGEYFYEYAGRNGTGYSYKVVFKPRHDSLYVFHSSGHVFKGARQ